jgi:hypothetical protein
MAYNSNIPQATDLISVSQADILANFQEINTLVGVNHATFGSGNDGKHTLMTLVNLGAPAAPAGNDINIFNSTVNGVAELSVQKTGGSSIPFTQSNQATNGFTRLPSGVILKWGTVTTVTNTATVTFPVGAGIPAFTNIFNVQVSVIGDGTSPTPNRAVTIVGGSITTTNFQVYGSQRTAQNGRTVTLHYFAIGN